MTHEERMAKADVKGSPEFYFSYVLQFDDGTFYVGSTNAPASRFIEHAAGKSTATADRGNFRVRMAMPFGTRKEAQYNEYRIQDALRVGADRLEAQIRVFDQLINIVRPQKTFSELQREEQKYELEMQIVFHHSHALMHNIGQRPGTACGYNGYQFTLLKTGAFSKRWPAMRISPATFMAARCAGDVCNTRHLTNRNSIPDRQLTICKRN